ncbi:STAS domain-containing protein [Oribacterium sp. WCC10]|uniref:STAS domain-containing protein n=1 Tax=Oribacterium sp. WCC10 TaxID=1855343 RepID=UPI0008F05684|nr:STAS domain-containing protein [Oribacterium sp. WCC10]SFG13873.1 anti-sigma B factor antagonist [Oribacterium sp. WCC10]
MLNITKKKEGSNLEFALEGRLDTTTAPQFDEQINAEIEGVTDLTMDFAALEYVSSAGLRVLLSAQKKMNKQGHMVIKNVSEEINEIFNVTGFSDILVIE